ncbi:MAG: HigA family addiction module antitoxin [Candidatus Anammoxibacter sp.]
MKKKRFSNGMRAIHPGEVLREDFMRPLNLSSNALAKALGVPSNRISQIAKEQRGISGDTAIRLAEYFDTTGEFWMKLQAEYDLKIADSSLPKSIRFSIRSYRTGEKIRI